MALWKTNFKREQVQWKRRRPCFDTLQVAPFAEIYEGSKNPHWLLNYRRLASFTFAWGRGEKGKENWKIRRPAATTGTGSKGKRRGAARFRWKSTTKSTLVKKAKGVFVLMASFEHEKTRVRLHREEGLLTGSHRRRFPPVLTGVPPLCCLFTPATKMSWSPPRETRSESFSSP